MKIELEPTDIDKLASEITLRVTERLKSGLVPSAPTEDTVFSAETLAAYLVTTPKWVYNHLSDLPHFKVDGLLRFRKKVIDKFFEQNPSKRPVLRDIR
jgi:hypothetical protein